MSAAIRGGEAFASADVSVAWMLGSEGLPSNLDPDRTAVLWESGALTYQELRDQALALAGAMRTRGLEHGDVVACMLHNRGEIFVLYFACAYAGLTFTPLNFRWEPGELTDAVRDADVRLLFTDSELLAKTSEAAAELEESLDIVVLDVDTAGPELAAMVAGPPLQGPYRTAEPHLILFSSGTTGRPKGICLTHRNIFSYGIVATIVFPDLTSDSVMLGTAAMFNTAGINEMVIPTFLAGGTVAILPSRKWSARRMVEFIDRWNVTHSLFFPTMLGPILEEDAGEAVDMATLRWVGVGGEQTPAALVDRFTQRWAHVEVGIGYGLTEGGLISHISQSEMLTRPTSVGRAVPFQTFKIANSDGTLVPAGEVGEIWTTSDFVTPGYWNAPELDADVLVDGWLRTGDLGRVDHEGYLFIEGRAKDVIISKGQNIYPAEIEGVLRSHPAVLDCAVVGVNDNEFGEAVCAVLVLRAGSSLSPCECVDYVVGQIASYKKPRFVVYRDQLPVSVNNKVLKRELSLSVADELGR